MTKISIADYFQTVTVDLWDHEFERQIVTRSVRPQLAVIGEELNKAVNDEDGDAVVEAIGKVLDLRLKPSDGKRTAASKLVNDKWLGDQVEVPQLLELLEEIGDAGNRPT